MLKKWIFVSLFVIGLSGCYSIGPRQMRGDRYNYNEAYQDTQKQELLLNIVRIKYLEPVSFFKVTSVTSAYNLNPRVSGTFNTGERTTLGVTPGISYMDEPTVSYAPVMSTDFINEILTPTDLTNMSYLLYGGIHDQNLLFRLVISSINEIDNAAALSDARLLSPPRYQYFYHLLALIDQLVANNNAKVVVVDLDSTKTLAIQFSKNSVQSPNALEIKKILRVPPCSDKIILTNQHPSCGNIVHIETRSVLGIMNYLSHGVHVPLCDILKHRAYEYYCPDGAPYNWEPLMKGLMSIYSSKEEPCNVFVKVCFNGTWFYIKDSDSDSKFTFGFLHDLIILTAGKELSSGPQPILTIPARAGR